MLRGDEEWQQLKAEKDRAEMAMYDTQAHIEALITELAKKQANIEALEAAIAEEERAKTKIRYELSVTSAAQISHVSSFQAAARQLCDHEINFVQSFPHGWITVEAIVDGSSDEPDTSDPSVSQSDEDVLIDKRTD